MRLTDDELAARINAICTAPGGLIDLDPRDAQLIACSVLANTTSGIETARPMTSSITLPFTPVSSASISVWPA